LALRDVLVSFNVVVDQSQLVSAQKNVNRLISQFNGLARAAQFALAFLGVGKLTDSIDEYVSIENKLKAVTESTEEFVAAQKGVEKIADDLLQPLSSVTDAYLRYKLATESLGASQEEVLDFTKRVTQAMILSGATAEEAHRAAVQLAQGFGKNFKAAAQDLKSVKEQAPVLARIIERAAGALPGSLLVAAKSGKITSRLVFDAVRAAGEDLDRDFAKRQKRFEDIFNLLGNQWLQLIKELKPAFVPVIDFLERIVKWIRDWVKDGSALNSVIAAAITAVTALTYFFGGFALSVAAAAAPFLLLFGLLEDFTAFVRGDESLLEEWLDRLLGEDKVEEVRGRIQELIKLLGTFFAALAGENSPEVEMAAWRFERAMRGAVDRVLAYAKEKLIGWAQDAFGVHPQGPQAQSDVENAANKAAHPIIDWFADVSGFKDDVRAARERMGVDPYTGVPLAKAGGGLVTDTAIPEPVWTPPPNYAGAAGSGYVAPPNITNNITVQGNADAPVARDIATQTGRATAAALGRDRTAVGAVFGVQP